MIHYGLPVTKDKNAAKVRLLNAMNQFKLEVPAWILKLEGELKKEWEGENRKMKKIVSGGTKKEKGVKSAGGDGGGSQMFMPSQGMSFNRESHKYALGSPHTELCSQRVDQIRYVGV